MLSKTGPISPLSPSPYQCLSNLRKRAYTRACELSKTIVGIVALLIACGVWIGIGLMVLKIALGGEL